MKSLFQAQWSLVSPSLRTRLGGSDERLWQCSADSQKRGGRTEQVSRLRAEGRSARKPVATAPPFPPGAPPAMEAGGKQRQFRGLLPRQQNAGKSVPDSANRLLGEAPSPGEGPGARGLGRPLLLPPRPSSAQLTNDPPLELLKRLAARSVHSVCKGKS